MKKRRQTHIQKHAHRLEQAFHYYSENDYFVSFLLFLFVCYYYCLLAHGLFFVALFALLEDTLHLVYLYIFLHPFLLFPLFVI